MQESVEADIVLIYMDGSGIERKIVATVYNATTNEINH